MTLPVSAVFGPTFQGEGPSTGRLAAFIRLGGCNLTCARCDTPHTWDASRFDLRAELTPMSAQQILAKVPDAPLVVLTGGEPTLHQAKPAFAELLAGLADRDVEVETNGTRVPAGPLLAGNIRHNVSPKLAGPMSVDPASKRIVPAALDAYADLARQARAIVKIVVSGRTSARKAIDLTDAHQIPRHRVWLMPEGTKIDRLLDDARIIADIALEAGVNLTLRQHLLLWPDAPRER